MTDDRSLERVARSWLDLGPTEAPDHAVDAALLRIQTTSQERDWRVQSPWRIRPMTLSARLAAAAVAIAILAVGGALVIRPGVSGVAATPSPPASSPASPSASPEASSSASGTSAVDYSTLGGRILVEHLGNAPDLSEMPTDQYHPERRRLYWMDPKSMTGATAVEFLPGQPSTGKLNADVSRDGRQIVFMDTADPADIWIANADGTGLRDLSGDCTCSELDPAFDPTGAKVVFVHLQGAFRASAYGANLGVNWDGRASVASWLAIRDLASGKVTKLDATARSGADGLPYQPAWSPDGTQIAFNRVTWETGGAPTGQLQVVDLSSGSVRTLTTSDPQSADPKATMPGDPDWSPDSSTIVFSDYPSSTMGSIGDLPGGRIFRIGADGSGLKRLVNGSGASYVPDGRIVFQDNYFWVMNADGTGALPVNLRGDDLTDLPQGFAYVPHWVGQP